MHELQQYNSAMQCHSIWKDLKNGIPPRGFHFESAKIKLLVVAKNPGQYDDWLICMISSQLHQKIQELDEVISTEDSDFIQSGLKLPSVIRVSRLAVVEGDILLGKLGQISHDRLSRVRQNLAKWISGA